MSYQEQLEQMKNEIMSYFVGLLKSKKSHKIEVSKYDINCIIFMGDFEYKLRYLSLLKGDMVRFMFTNDFDQDEWFDGNLDIDNLAHIADELKAKYGEPSSTD